jgi:hypothetical protein
MALCHRIQYLRKEHEELLHLAKRIAEVLESASKNDFEKQLGVLNELRSLNHGLAGVVEHCHAENRIVESTYQHYLEQKERDRIHAEHEEIIRAIANFREELKFATVDRTMGILIPGMEVVNRLQDHIAFEREMLGRIAEIGKPAKRLVGQKRAKRKTQAKRRRNFAKQKAAIKVMRVVPYTLEPHPEL